ncbi:MAG: xylulokinase [Anaerolineaceae bacterium]
MTNDKPYVLAFDIGTSSLKAVVYAYSGKSIASESFRYEMITPEPGWAEANINDWKVALEFVLNKLKNNGSLLKEIQIVAFTGQMHTAVLLDESLEPLSPTILWLDRRAVKETEELLKLWSLPPHQLNSTYTIPKLLWLKRHRPEVIAKTNYIIWPKDYLRFLFTGEIMTDMTEAGGAGLLNWQTNLWAEDRLVDIGLDPKILPSIKHPEDDGGVIRKEIVLKYGINPNAKVIVGAGDVLALISSAPPAIGRVTCSLGSSSMVFSPMDANKKIVDPLNRIYTYPLLEYPLLGGVSSTTGAALKWACQTLFPELEFDQAIEEALRIPEGCDGLLFLPFLSGERSPFWNDHLRGGFYGLTLSSSRAVILRAVMEGIGYSLKYLIDIYKSLGEPIKEIAIAGGGAITKGWPQIIANICQIPVCIYTGQETVTHALFAYSCKAMNDGRSFNQALLQTFDEMEWIEPNSHYKEIYNNIYERYVRIADFLHQNIK